jgi:hypothetical protein
MRLRPEVFAHVGRDFTEDNPAPPGEGWYLPDLGFDDATPLRVHPRHLLEGWERDVVDCWLHCRPEMGPGHLPDPGGYLDQPLLVLKAFDICAAVDAALRKKPGE